jgi:glycosyltransferase involved in cell wall biosynthesis
MKKVFFLSHDASGTGAPNSLIRIIRWLKDNDVVEPFIVLKDGGPLTSMFCSIAPTFIWDRQTPKWHKNILPKLKKNISINLSTKELFKKISEFAPELIFVNSVANCAVIPLIKQIIDKPLILRAPEQEMSIHRFAGYLNFEKAVPFIDFFIVVNNITKNLLINKFNVSKDKISIIPGGIDDNDLNIQTSKENLSIPFYNPKNPPLLILGSGTTEWRKGPDLFIETALHFKNIYTQDFLFCWVGPINYYIQMQFEYDINHSGLERNVFLIGYKPNIHDYYSAADIFFLSSREDPFPRVCIEAALHKTPIICFDNAGGIIDFVSDDAGVVVPYLDTFYAAQVINKLANDSTLRDKLASKAKYKAENLHMDKLGYLFIEAFQNLNGKG